MSRIADSGSRQRRLALALAIPALMVTIGVCAVEAWRLIVPSRAQIGARVYTSLGEAIAMDDVIGAHEFLRRGENPNALITVYDPVLTGGRQLQVAPIVWAAAAGRRQIAQMLLGAGVTFTREADALAPCVADRLGYHDIAADIRKFASPPLASPCPAAVPGAPLAAYAAELH